MEKKQIKLTETVETKCTQVSSLTSNFLLQKYYKTPDTTATVQISCYSNDHFMFSVTGIASHTYHAFVLLKESSVITATIYIFKFRLNQYENF